MKQYILSKWIILMGINSLILNSCAPEQESIGVLSSDITESIYSSVTLEPEFLYSVYSEIPGRIIKFQKETGDSISFGDVLCTISAIEAKNHSENAELNLKLIQSKLFGDASVIADLEKEIRVAQHQFTVDSTQLTRVETLNTKKLASDVELEQAQLKARSSKVRLENLRTQKKRSQRELKIQQQQAKNTYESALSTSSNTTITSIVNGIVYDVYKENGELVNSQQPIALIGSKSDFIIRMLVDEADITQVKIGQKVRVSLESYSNQTFTAIIDQIHPKMDAQTQSFQVIAKFVNSPPKLYLGLTGEANIIVRHVENAIVIPREYLIDDKYVQTVNGKKKVEIGIKSLSYVQIIDGLEAKEIIYLPLP